MVAFGASRLLVMLTLIAAAAAQCSSHGSKLPDNSCEVCLKIE
jgi:hypothetical protein